jgi:anti-anti-sigma factor
MNFIIHNEANYSSIKVVCERLDSFISPELKAELVLLSTKGAINIILDLYGVGYCDSSGLSAILVGNRLCEDSEGTFIICNLSQGVDKMIRMAMLDSILLITSDMAKAKRLLIKKTEMK